MEGRIVYYSFMRHKINKNYLALAKPCILSLTVKVLPLMLTIQSKSKFNKNYKI
jgi:hypothetical protein